MRLTETKVAGRCAHPEAVRVACAAGPGRSAVGPFTHPGQLGPGPRRQEDDNIWAAGVNVSSGFAPRCWSASSVRFVLADQDGRATHGGTMTVVAGIIALLLLGYLVVALLNPERF